MKRPINDEDIWICSQCGHGLGRHRCPNHESPVIGSYIDKLEKKNKELIAALRNVAECNFDDERKIKHLYGDLINLPIE